ncbi:hypothetical protein F5I97DRAFT_546767 [Phlebopus sp. FC_14]|nr:hypothetical protein F5I97DRAFT_546767 [Phlebopus sp. FC_14]
MGSPPTVAVIGTCDTKYQALLYVKDTINAGGLCRAILIDIGTYEPPDSEQIDISRSQVLGALTEDIKDTSTRAAALNVMARALSMTLARLRIDGTIAGVIGAGGSGNTSVCAAAFRGALPIGFPKLILSTMASGHTTPYVGETDMTMMYSVADIAGMNPFLETVLGNAANAIAGMSLGSAAKRTRESHRPSVAVTVFGLTTPCVQVATKKLEELGYSVVAFHATGSGGLSMERLVREGYFIGVLDLTTTELADELVGGVLSAGPRRLEAAAEACIPQVVSVGAVDMVNFGPASTVPERFRDRTFVHHNDTVTLMRTSPGECARLGEIIAEKLSKALPNKTRVILPLRGLSGIDKRGGPFYDVTADAALLDALRGGNLQCGIEEIDTDINDPSFAVAAAMALHKLVVQCGGQKGGV